MGLWEVGETSYHVSNFLLNHWKKNSLKIMKKQNSDRVYIVDGRERIGKSTFVFQQMGVIEPELFETPEKFLNRVCIDAFEFNKVARETKNGVVAFDEGFRGFSSRAALSKTNRILIQTLMEMGQNNNILFIVLPSVFLLDVYPALIRSDGLFHIRTDKKSKKRCWDGYNRGDKNQIYKEGARKGWRYKRTLFRGNFYSKFAGGKAFEKEYLDKKQKAFAEISKEMMKPDIKKDEYFQRNELIKIFKRKYGLGARKIADLIRENANFNLEKTTIIEILRKTKENDEKGILAPKIVGETE